MSLQIAAAASVFLATGFASVWALRGARRPADARIRALAAAGASGAGLAAVPFSERVIVPMAEAVGRAFAGVLPAAFLRRTQQRLIMAGQPTKASILYASMLVLGCAIAVAFALLVLATSNGSRPLEAMLAGVVGFLGGAYLPVFWLSGRVRARQRAMLRGLPDSLDLLTVCVEAGLALDGALHQVVEKQSGPIVDELRQTLREVALGKTRKDALLGLADRSGLEDVRSFVLAILQAEQLGTSLAKVLRVQSDRVRVRRRQRAEQDARRAPVRMVFPLVFCLMPSLFIFILGPIIVKLVGFLSDQ